MPFPSPTAALIGGSASTPSPWSTRLFECGESAPLKHWACATCLLPCAAALAKSKVDASHPVYNLCCWSPLGSYNSIRLDYHIEGTCGDDCGNVIFCPCCAVRRAYTEADVRSPAHAPTPSREWKTSLFACSATEMCFALLCPCVMTHRVRQLMQSGTDQYFDCCCVLPTSMYGAVRHKYEIKSECADCPFIEDIGVGVACFPCALARAQREAIAQQITGMASAVTGKVNDLKAKAFTAIGKK